MSGVKGSFVQYDPAVLGRPKRPRPLAIVTKAAGVLVLFMLSAKVLHQALMNHEAGTRNEDLSGTQHFGSPHVRVPQTVDYQLNLSQAWRNPGES